MTIYRSQYQSYKYIYQQITILPFKAEDKPSQQYIYNQYQYKDYKIMFSHNHCSIRFSILIVALIAASVWSASKPRVRNSLSS